MKTRRGILIALGAGVLAAPLASLAQQTVKVRRIGFLGAEAASGYSSRIEALRAGLRDLGYVEGKNIVIEYRWGEGKYDRLPDLAGELVRLKVDVIVTHAATGTLAAKRATTTIPIVMATMGDPVALGVVASLARPGGNITGSVFFQTELMAKRVELLKEAMPRITRVAVLMLRDNPTSQQVLQAMESTANSLKVELQKFEVRGPDEFDSAFSAMAKKRVDAVVIQETPVFIVNANGVAGLAREKRILSIGDRGYAEAGGMIGYGANLLDLYRRVAYFVDKILKGTKPADLPVEQASKFELVLNLKTAKLLGVKFPQAILVRADRVIE